MKNTAGNIIINLKHTIGVLIESHEFRLLIIDLLRVLRDIVEKLFKK